MQTSKQLITHTVNITDQSQRVYLGEDLLLADKPIGFATITPGGETLVSGRQTLSPVSSDYIVLVNKSREVINRLPVSELRTRFVNGCPLALNGSAIDYSSSYFLRTRPTTAEQGRTYCLVFSVLSGVNPSAPFADYISVVYPAGGTGFKQLYFPDKQSLRGRQLTGFSITPDLDFTPDYKAGATADVIARTSVTLVDTAGQIAVNNIPLTLFVTGAGILPAYRLANLNIDWPRSYLNVMPAETPTADIDFHFNLSLSKNW